MFAYMPRGGYHHTPNPLISWDSDSDGGGHGGVELLRGQMWPVSSGLIALIAGFDRMQMMHCLC